MAAITDPGRSAVGLQAGRRVVKSNPGVAETQRVVFGQQRVWVPKIAGLAALELQFSRCRSSAPSMFGGIGQNFGGLASAVQWDPALTDLRPLQVGNHARESIGRIGKLGGYSIRKPGLWNRSSAPVGGNGLLDGVETTDRMLGDRVETV